MQLDISLEMAHKHGIPSQIESDELAKLQQDPPAWLAQSWANRTGKRPVWVTLKCDVCGKTESTRPKKWWPDYTWLSCFDHPASAVPAAMPGMIRSEVEGIGSHYVAIVDEPERRKTGF
ncbi:hypothetical protein [Humidisolicoccus flavus]|uniref:hypothetical protein n=1 Tax=Humidisolicoccus flavus TaxID=3111414 RepID=UPI00324DD962